MDRRLFLRNSAATVGAFVTADAAERVPQDAPARIGRPVRAVSIGFRPGLPLEQIADRVDQEGARGADLIALPETCRGQNERSQERLDGATVSTMARLASKHRTYVVCPIDRRDGERRLNSAVLIDRRGQVAAVYDKLFPYNEEFVKPPAVQPGQAVVVAATDFGRLGLAICFDVNWAPLWRRLADLGAELVVWPSAYSAGRSLQARAIDFNYAVISSTWVPDCRVYDIDGEELVHESENQSNVLNVTRHTFDLDRCLFHQDYNLPAKLERLLKEHGEDVEREKWLPAEGWFVLKAKRTGVSARELAKRYGLEEKRPYINRSRGEIDIRRGWEFVG